MIIEDGNIRLSSMKKQFMKRLICNEKSNANSDSDVSDSDMTIIINDKGRVEK